LAQLVDISCAIGIISLPGQLSLTCKLRVYLLLDVLTNNVALPSRVWLFASLLHCFCRYGQEWHSEPMEIWERWLEPYRGKSLTDPALIATQKPDFYLAEEPRLKAKGMYWGTLAP
jgi:hypothetical protein